MESEQEPDKISSDKLFYWVMAVFIIGILICAGVMYFSPKEPAPERMTYNKFTFVKQGGLWYTNWQKGGNVFILSLRYNPKEAEQVKILGRLDENSTFNNRDLIYITFDPVGNDLSHIALAAAELSLNLKRALNVNVKAACIANETIACKDRPIVTCNDTGKAVIFLKEDPESRMILTDNCMTLQGSGMEIMRVVDRILYIWYGIMAN